MVHQPITSIRELMISSKRFSQLGDLDLDYSPSYLFSKMIEFDLPIVAENILDMGHEWDHFCVDEAIEHDSFKFIIWLHFDSNLYYLPENAYAHASHLKKVYMLNFLRENDIGFPDDRCIVDTPIWFKNFSDSDVSYRVARIIREDNLYELQSVYGTYTLDNNMLTEACVYGSMRVLAFLMYDKLLVPSPRDFNISRVMFRKDVEEEMNGFLNLYS